MTQMTIKSSHLCAVNLLLLLNAVIDAHVIETTPLCGTMDGSPPPKDSDKIYFKDRTQGIRTVEVNGTIYACYPDGTMVDTTSSAQSSAESGETTDDTTLQSRIQSDDDQPLNRHPVREAAAPSHVPSRASYSANINRCAEPNQLYCTNDTSYPIDHIEKLLRKHIHKFADVFGSDSTVNALSTRIDGFDEVQLCDYTEKVIYPISGKTQDGTELYIFNTAEHKQGVRVSICRNLGQPCHMSDGFPNNYRTECKQHMVYRELLSLSPDGVPIKEKFKFPACCSCAVYRL